MGKSGDMISASTIRGPFLAVALFAAASVLLPHNVAAEQINDPVDAQPLDIPLGPMGNNMSLSDPDDTLAPAKPASPAQPETSPAEAKPLTAPEPALMRIIFPVGTAALDDATVEKIRSFAESFRTRGGRLTLIGYAGDPRATDSNTRRLSLRRVLAVRAEFLEQGVARERLTVRALGGVTDTGNPNRVDIVKSGR
jgi:outer membrane protein OmpA-like peptidoglycan-associated protein